MVWMSSSVATGHSLAASRSATRSRPASNRRLSSRVSTPPCQSATAHALERRTSKGQSRKSVPMERLSRSSASAGPAAKRPPQSLCVAPPPVAAEGWRSPAAPAVASLWGGPPAVPTSTSLICHSGSRSPPSAAAAGGDHSRGGPRTAPRARSAALRVETVATPGPRREPEPSSVRGDELRARRRLGGVGARRALRRQLAVLQRPHALRQPVQADEARRVRLLVDVVLAEG